jgi:ethanolamine utilization protein EutN
MFLAKVEGSVVATKKDANMSGRKLLLLRPQLVDDKDPLASKPGSNTVIAVDSVGAGLGELVLFCQGSSARLAHRSCARRPWTRLIIGIVDVRGCPGAANFLSAEQNVQAVSADLEQTGTAVGGCSDSAVRYGEPF